jgi:hypothetical protein
MEVLGATGWHDVCEFVGIVAEERREGKDFDASSLRNQRSERFVHGF